MEIFKNLDEIKKSGLPFSWWDAIFGYKFAFRLVALIQNTKITPNHLTLMGVLVVMVACLLIMFGNYLVLAGGAVLLQSSCPN